MPRRSPCPSSPTSPMKRMSLAVWIPASSIARTIASSTASERVSSPMPGAIEARAVALDLHVRAFRKHGVQVRGDRDQRAAAGAFAHAHDVAFGVALDAGEPALRAASRDTPRRAVFLERRRRNLGQRDDLVDQPIVIAIDRGHRRGQLRVRGDALDGRVDRRHLRARCRRYEESDDEQSEQQAKRRHVRQFYRTRPPTSPVRCSPRAPGCR